MPTTSNPAFRNLQRGGFGGGRPHGAAAGQYGQASGTYGGYSPASYPGYTEPTKAADRPMTTDDVVMRTSFTLAAALVTGSLTVIFNANVLAAPAAIVGLVLALVIIFGRKANAAMVLCYAGAEGIFLGAITGLFNRIYPGVALEAIAGTFGVFAAMLVVYKTGAVKVTPRTTKWIIGATFGAFVIMMVNVFAHLFGGGLGIRDGGPTAIIFSLIVIAIAAFNLLLDFDQADKLIRAGAPAKMAWYVAFGLTVTLVWLYLEILRLLSYMQRN